MVAAAGFTRPPGSAAVCRGTNLLMWTVLLLIGASQVAAKPINNETNIYMSYTTPFMRAADYTIGALTAQTVITDEPTVTDHPTVAVSVPAPQLLIKEPHQPSALQRMQDTLYDGLAYAGMRLRYDLDSGGKKTEGTDVPRALPGALIRLGIGAIVFGIKLAAHLFMQICARPAGFILTCYIARIWPAVLNDDNELDYEVLSRPFWYLVCFWDVARGTVYTLEDGTYDMLDAQVVTQRLLDYVAQGNWTTVLAGLFLTCRLVELMPKSWVSAASLRPICKKAATNLQVPQGSGDATIEKSETGWLGPIRKKAATNLQEDSGLDGPDPPEPSTYKMAPEDFESQETFLKACKRLRRKYRKEYLKGLTLKDRFSHVNHDLQESFMKEQLRLAWGG